MVKKSLVIIVILLLLCINDKKVNAESSIEMFVVYDKLEYQRGDAVDISIDIPAFANLFEVIIRYTYDDTIMEPIPKDSQYFYLDNHSIFSNFIVNKKFDTNIIYAEMMKDSVEDGYYSSYKNNLCQVSFKMLKAVDDITMYFNNDNLQIYLFDNNHELIKYELKYQERINTMWTTENLELEVYSALPSINELFVVKNRDDDQYLMFIDQNIDLSLVSDQILQVGLFDKITGNYQTFSKIVKVVDTTKPIINGESEVKINDYELDNFDFYHQVEVSDNYDQSPTLNLKYYGEGQEEISKDEAISYLKKHLQIKVGYCATDKSNNMSDELLISYQLIDTIAPIIYGPTELFIKDVELDNYIVDTIYSAEDNLDQVMKIVLTLYDENYNIINHLKETLTVNRGCIVEAFAIDNNQNVSEKLVTKVYLIDTTCPIIVTIDEKTINDVDIDDFDFINLIEIEDNDIRPCNVECKYFIATEKNLEDFKMLLKKGKEGIIEYYVSDYSGNETIVSVNVKALDTTAPSIQVNIENDGLYRELSEIIWEVTDNFENEIIVNVYLDKEKYNPSMLKEGQHNLFIEAIDQNGNIKSINYNFIISNAGFIENLFNGNIKIKNSTYIYIIVGLSVILVILKVIYNRHRKISHS